MAEQQQPNERSWQVTGLDRRTFLKGTAGTAAFLVVQSAFDLDAVAQQADQNPGLQFLNPIDAPTIEAMAERIWPTTEDSLGARDAGVLAYIDRSLAGRYEELQLAYRDGIKAIDRLSQEQHGGRFVELAPEQQDALLTAISEGEIEESPMVVAQEGLEEATSPSQQLQSQIAGIGLPSESGLQVFFDLVRTHTMEGLFADPIYGGNRDFAGWRAVGYPGAHFVYTEEEQQSFEPLNKPFQSLADF